MCKCRLYVVVMTVVHVCLSVCLSVCVCYSALCVDDVTESRDGRHDDQQVLADKTREAADVGDDKRANDETDSVDVVRQLSSSQRASDNKDEMISELTRDKEKLCDEIELMKTSLTLADNNSHR